MSKETFAMIKKYKVAEKVAEIVKKLLQVYDENGDSFDDYIYHDEKLTNFYTDDDELGTLTIEARGRDQMIGISFLGFVETDNIDVRFELIEYFNVNELEEFYALLKTMSTQRSKLKRETKRI